jgi:hypothetical protein
MTPRDDGSSFYVIPGSDTLVNGVLITSPETVSGPATVTTGTDDATVYTELSTGQYVEVDVYGSGTTGTTGTDATCSADTGSFDAQMAFSQGGVWVDDDAAAPTAVIAQLKLPSRMDNCFADPRWTINSFRVRRARGTHNTTLAGLGTQYQVLYTGTDDVFSFTMYSGDGGQVLYNDSADGSSVPVNSTVTISSDAGGKTPVVSGQGGGTLASLRR